MEPIDQAIGKDNPRPLFLYPGFTKILKNDLENLLNNSLDPLTASGCTAAAEICEGVAADNKGGQGRDQVILGDGKGGAPERPPSKPPIKEEGRGGIFGGENEPSISVMAQISTTAAMTGNNVAVSTEKVQKGQSAIDLDGKEEILRDSTGGKCAQGSTGINMTGEGEGGPQDSMPANSGAVTETLDSVAPQNKTGQGREHKIEVDGKDETPGETIGQMSDDNMNRGSPGCGQTCCEDSVTAKSRSVTECLVTLTNDQMKRQEREHIVGFEIDEETPDDVPDQSPVKGLRIGNKGNNIYSLHDLAGAQNLGAVRNFFEEMCDRKHAIGHEDKEKTSAKIRGNQSIGIKNGQDFRRTGNIPQGSGTPQCEDVAVNIEVMANDEEGSKPEQGIVLQEKERYPDIIPDVPSIKIPSEVRKRDRKINPQDLLTTQSGAVADTVESTFIAVEIESRKRQSPKQAVTQNKNDNTPKQNDSETSFAEECEGKNQEPQAEPRHSVAIQGEAAAETIVAVGNTMERGGCRQAVDVSGGKEALNKYPDTSPFINLGEEHIAGTESEIQKSAIAHDETGPLVFEAVAMKDVYWRRWNRVLSRNEKDHIPHEVLKYFEGPNDQAAIRESYSRELAKAQGKAAKNISKASTADFEGNPGGNQVNGVRGNKEVLISNPDTNFSESLCGEDDGGRKGLPQVLSIKQSETVRETLETMTMKIEGRCKWERAIGPEKKNDPRENLPKLDLESRSVESIRGGEKDPRSSKKGQGGTATGTFEAMAVNTEDRRWWDGIFGVEGEKGAPVKPSNKSSVKVWDKEVTDGKKIIPRSSVTPFVETLTEPLVCVTLYAKPGQGQGQSQGVGCKERENTQTNPLYKLSTDGPGEEYTGESKIKTHGSAEEKDTTEKPMSMVLSIDSEEEEGVEGDIMHEDMKEVLGKHANEAPMENLGEKQTGRKHNGHDNTKTAKSKPRAMAAEILGAWAVPDKEGLGRKLSVGSEPNADARDAHLSVVLNRNPDELFFGSQRKVRAPGKETVDKNEFSFSKINLAFVRGDDSPTEHEAEGVKAPAADDRMGSLGIKLLNRKEDQACQSTVVCSVNGSSVVEASAGARARTVELGKVVEVPEFMETSCESFDQESARLRSLEVGLSSKKWKLRETLTGIHSIETESEREKDLLAWSTTSGCASNWVSNKSSALNVARPIDVGFSRGRGEQDSESVLPTSVDTGASDYLCDKDSAELGLARCSTSAKNNWIGPAAAHSEQTELRGRSISVDTPIAGNGDSDEKCNEEKARSKLLVAGPFNTKRAQSEKSSMAREVGLQFGVEGGWEVAGLTSGAAPERIDRESYRVRPLETDLQSRKEEETEDSGVSFAVKTQFGGERNLGESCASDGDHRGSSDGKGFEIGPSKDSLAELEYNGSDGQAVVRPPFETDVSRRKRNAIGYFVIQKTELRGEPGSVAVSSAETKSGGGSDSSEIDVGGEVCSPPLSPGSRSGDIFEGSVDEKWPWLSQFQKPPHEDGTVPRSLDGSTLVDYPGKGYLLFSDGDGAPSRASDDAHEDAVEARMEEETSLYVFVLAGACLSFFALFCMFHASQETWRQPSLVIDTRLKHPSLIPDQTRYERHNIRVNCPTPCGHTCKEDYGEGGGVLRFQIHGVVEYSNTEYVRLLPPSPSTPNSHCRNLRIVYSSVEEDSVRVRKHVPTCSLEEGSPSEPSTQTSKAILQGGATAHYMNSVGCADLQVRKKSTPIYIV